MRIRDSNANNVARTCRAQQGMMSLLDPFCLFVYAPIHCNCNLTDKEDLPVSMSSLSHLHGVMNQGWFVLEAVGANI
jgi:hypothetical protein